MGQGEAEINPGLAEVKVQIASQAGRGLDQGRKITAGVIEILPILRNSGVNEAKLVSVQTESEFKIIPQGVA